MISDKLKNLLIRTASGIVLLAVVLAAVFTNQYTFTALMLLIGEVVVWEYVRLVDKGREVKIVKWLPMLVAGCVILLPLAECRLMAGVAAMVLVPLCFVLELFRKQPHPLENGAVELSAIIYAAMPLMLFGLMAGVWSGNYNPQFAMAFIATVWVNDIFAYLTGVTLGRHKMMERISPKKSWEGFVGGVIFAVGFAMVAGWYLGFNVWLWAGFGAVIVVGAVLGDFVESMFKREAGVKDSGNILPGHGGMMDRFDALLLALPWASVYWFIFLR